jgi:hypothetical protein
MVMSILQTPYRNRTGGNVLRLMNSDTLYLSFWNSQIAQEIICRSVCPLAHANMRTSCLWRLLCREKPSFKSSRELGRISKIEEISCRGLSFLSSLDGKAVFISNIFSSIFKT